MRNKLEDKFSYDSIELTIALAIVEGIFLGMGENST